MDDFVRHSLPRMDWGFGNPNKTAALIALIMATVWAFAYLRKWGFWVGMICFTGLGICLILTQSRGGVVGMVLGHLIVLLWAPRPFPISRCIAIGGACLILSISAFAIDAETRYTQGFEGNDQSIDNRILIWKEAPLMIHDAPNGWGMGNSGNAYMQWYQPLERGEGYRTLVNSHLTWLVELNWWGRIAYLAFWGLALVLVAPCLRFRWFSIPLAIWVSWGVCGFFSSVEEVATLWIFPLISLIVAIFTRFKKNTWPQFPHWLGMIAVFFALIMGVVCCGIQMSTRSLIYCPHEGIVTLGSRSPKVWIVAPNQSVLGEHYGHEIRRGFNANPIFQKMGVGVACDIKRIPLGQILIFSESVSFSIDALKPTQIILINPSINLEITHILINSTKMTIILGEYSSNKAFWNEQSHIHPELKLVLVDGSEEYIANWMSVVALAINR